MMDGNNYITFSREDGSVQLNLIGRTLNVTIVERNGQIIESDFDVSDWPISAKCESLLVIGNYLKTKSLNCMALDLRIDDAFSDWIKLQEMSRAQAEIDLVPEALNRRLTTPPGAWVLKIGSLIFRKKTLEILENEVADFREECYEALSHGKIWRYRMLVVIYNALFLAKPARFLIGVVWKLVTSEHREKAKARG
jgi:hypothetical protein